MRSPVILIGFTVDPVAVGSGGDPQFAFSYDMKPSGRPVNQDPGIARSRHPISSAKSGNGIKRNHGDLSVAGALSNASRTSGGIFILKRRINLPRM